MHDGVWLNAKLATMTGTVIHDGALATSGGRISWVGERRQWKEEARREHDARGAWILPAFVDCHTHLVYAGNRAHEFELRLKGASYEDDSSAKATILIGGDEQDYIAGVRRAQELHRKPIEGEVAQ